MDTVISSDGTRISYAVSGKGPTLVLVHGTTADHTRWAGILPNLNVRFTVFAMDRRGRGASGDAPDYDLGREFEDVAAVVRAAGPNAMLVGHSYGALCAMEAALLVDNLSRLVLYEPAFPPDDTPIYAPGTRERYERVLADGNREGLLELFFREVVEMPDDMLNALRKDPSWPARIAAAHTLVRELGDADYRFEPDRFRGLNVPTLLLLGEKSPEFLKAATRLVDAALPDSRVVELPGQGHVAMNTAPEMFVREVVSFLQK